MTSQVFYPHAIAFSTASTNITQLSNITPMYALQDVMEFSSGDVAPFWSGSLTSAPTCGFGSRQVKDLLDLCDPAAAHAKGKSYVAHDGSAGNVDVIYRQGESYGFRIADATATHESMRMTKGFYRWEGITANQGALAEVNGVLAAGWDGTNDPLVVTQAALSVDQAVDSLFTLGPIKINGTAYDGLQGYTWANNIVPDFVFDGGTPFPTYMGLATYSPTITARYRNNQLFRSLTSRGTAITAFELYLRKLLAGDICVPDATEEHIKFSATAGIAKARQVANGITDVTFQLQRPNASSTCFTYDTTAAIT